MKRLIIALCIGLALVVGLLTGCVSGTGVTQTVTEPGVSAEPREGWHAMIEKISLWQNGEEQVIDPLQNPKEYIQIGDLLIETLHKLNLQAVCVFAHETVEEEIKQRDEVVELIFKEPVDITISQLVQPDKARILENIKAVIFILQDNLGQGLQAHVLIGSEYKEGKIGYGCWAIQQEGSNELDKSWADEVIKIISTEKMAKTAEQKLCEDTGGVWVNNRCLCPPGSTFTSEGCIAHSQYCPIDKIAKDYLLNSPTFKLDGIEDSLELVAVNTLKSTGCWEFVFEFQCGHAGYGDRTGQTLPEVITPHTARITVEQGKVDSAIMDEKWDMMKQEQLPGLTETTPLPPAWHLMTERGFLWENGTEQFVAGENSPMSKFLFQTLHRLNLQAKCAIFEEDIEEIKGNDKVIEMTFRFPEDIVISQWIGNHYRTLENVKSALFILEDNLDEGLEAHILVGSGTEGWSCWAIQQEGSNELDRTWIDEINNILSGAS